MERILHLELMSELLQFFQEETRRKIKEFPQQKKTRNSTKWELEKWVAQETHNITVNI